MTTPHRLQRILGLPVLIVIALLIQGIKGNCNQESCSTTYRQEKAPEASTREFCLPLNRYKHCLELTSHNCTGSLHFHTVNKVVATLMENNKCDGILTKEDLTELNSINQTDMLMGSNTLPKTDVCDFEGDPTPSHCVLFGDPHLKTFHGEFMTCRIQKAWPLLSNPYLAVQVSNELVGPELKATATTKVTVIIKGHDQCGAEKTYEASTEALPKAFMDGSTYSGDRENPTVSISEELPGEYAIIYIRYINATIGIRKINKYLTVTATLPQEILEANESDPGDMQLCTQGCPVSERLVPSWGSGSPTAMSQEKALKLCQEFKMTDYYLDSCVFDLVTTGDKSFIAAARAAHADLWSHDPRTAGLTLDNCTNFPCNINAYSGSKCLISEFYSVLLVAVMTSLFISNWSQTNLISR